MPNPKYIMRRVRLALVYSILILVISGLSYMGYILYLKLRRPAESPFNAIPENTALIIKLNRASSLWEDINRTNLLWKQLTRFPGISAIRDEIEMLDSASRKNATINKIFKQYNLLISITVSGRTSFGALYITMVPGADPESSILEFIKKISDPQPSHFETPYAETRIHRIQAQNNKDPFYFAVLKGVFMGSFHDDLVKKAIDRLSLNTPRLASAGFQKVESTTGKKVDANIYVNYRYFSLVLSKVIRTEFQTDLLRVTRFADWSGLDLIIKKDELMLNGYTVASDSSIHFLSLFSDQTPQKIDITRVIPAAISYFTFYGWEDPGEFMRRLQERNLRNENFAAENNPASSFIEKYSIEASPFFLTWIGNQAGLFMIEKGAPITGPMVFAAFQTRDSLRTLEYLVRLADTLAIKVDSIKYKGHKITGLHLPSVLQVLFGELFGKAGSDYCMFFNDWVFFGKDRKSLEYLIDTYLEGNTLDKNRDFLEFSNDIPDKANIYCYFNTPNSVSTLKSMLNDDVNIQMNPVMDSLKKFESVAFQFNNQEGIFYSSFYMRFNPNQNQEGPLQWKVSLDTTIAGSPQIIDAQDQPFIVSTDVVGKLYKISADGHIRWKIPVMGKIQGEIHPIRLVHDDSLYILFNTDTHLYLVRSDGQFANRFPMRFPLHAVNGLTVLDYNKIRDYRILVAFQDNRIYNFTLDGKSVPGWERPGLDEDIRKPVTHLIADHTDLLILAGNKGKALIADRTGKPRIMLSPRFVHSPNSEFYINKSGKKGILITSDPNGKVIYIQENGRTTEVTMNLFSQGHYFYYEDMDGNNHPEFIFFDKNTLYYYNRNYKLIYSYGFRREITNPPFVLHAPGGKVMIGFVAPETNELYLFDQNGYREMESGIRGNTPFDIGRLEPVNQLNLVVGSGKFIKNYRLTQH